MRWHLCKQFLPVTTLAVVAVTCAPSANAQYGSGRYQQASTIAPQQPAVATPTSGRYGTSMPGVVRQPGLQSPVSGYPIQPQGITASMMPQSQFGYAPQPTSVPSFGHSSNMATQPPAVASSLGPAGPGFVSSFQPASLLPHQQTQQFPLADTTTVAPHVTPVFRESRSVDGSTPTLPASPPMMTQPSMMIRM